jgi:signal-transduction protein with cAMP-binding, CBS, and nucleotidyltransferase domain
MEDDDYRGIFSERDYTRNVILKGRSSSSTKVAEVMTVDLPVVDTSNTIEHCMDMMILHKCRYLLAFDDRSFSGVITIHDLLREVLANRDQLFDLTAARQLIDNEESEKIY